MAELTPGTPAGPEAAWTLRYATHLGYQPRALRPQFLATLGADASTDPAAHVRYAADLGMAGILYPWALSRPPQERAQVARALKETGLACSCVVCLPLDTLTSPLWTDRTRAGRAQLRSHVVRAAQVAGELGSTVLAALPAATQDPGRPDAESDADMEAAAANMREMAAIAGDHGQRIGVEPMIALPNMLLRSTAAAVDLVTRADSNSIGIIYDTGHVSMMDGDLLGALDQAFPHLALVQLVDQPGRVEPGAGELDLVPVAAEVARRGYDGLVDLEHGWRSPGQTGERDGLRRVREFDERVLRTSRQPSERQPRA